MNLTTGYVNLDTLKEGGEYMTDEKPKTMEDLQNYAEGSGSPYLTFDPSGVPIEGLYLGYEWETDPFGKEAGAKRPVYYIEINQEKKMLGSSSRPLAKAMIKAKPEVGNFIKITKIQGETQYDVTYEIETSDIPF